MMLTMRTMCGGRWLLLVVLVVWRTHGALSDCVQDGPCKCTSDQGTIDLTSVQKFTDQADPSMMWLFSYSPCTPFSEGFQDCVNVAVCQVSSDQSQSYPAGTVDSAMFGTDPTSGSTTVTYSSTDSSQTTRTTIVTLVCDQSGGQDSLQVMSEDPSTPTVYKMTLTSVHCCPSGSPGPSGGGSGGGGLSVGSILCIVVVAVVFVYIVVGVAVQKGVRKASGREVFPHYTMWSSVPVLIKEGAVFTVSKCRGRGPYEKI